MKVNLVALAAVAAIASAAPDANKDHQLEIRDDAIKVDKLTFFGSDNQPSDVAADDSVYFNDAEVLADSGNEKRSFTYFWWKKWWWWSGRRCNWCYRCSYHNGWGGCHHGRCCA